MHRRNMLWGAVSALSAAFAVSRANAAAEVPSTKLKVIYHLNDLDKVSFALGNIQNHLDGVGGPDHVTIALVIHGQALRAFHSASTDPRHFPARRSILKSWNRTRCLRQNHEVAECHAEACCRASSPTTAAA
nr:hypothetical protein [Bradyrhizobium jicamae]